MSKAFTSEETPDLGPLGRSAPRLKPGEVRYVTPEGQAALSEKLVGLKGEREQQAQRPESERASLADLDQRIAVLEETLRVLTVLAPEATPEGRVGFGTWVTLEDENGAEVRWRIVGPDEADAREGRVSVESPVARALIGRSEGESVEVQRPGGAAEFTIVRVSRTA
jgi:transcription elongation factor GreB